MDRHGLQCTVYWYDVRRLLLGHLFGFPRTEDTVHAYFSYHNHIRITVKSCFQLLELMPYALLSRLWSGREHANRWYVISTVRRRQKHGWPNILLLSRCLISRILAKGIPLSLDIYVSLLFFRCSASVHPWIHHSSLYQLSWTDCW